MSEMRTLPDNFEPLDPEKHQALRFSELSHFNFAKSLSSVPISLTELQQAANFYPIVLLGDGSPVPNVLLSIENGTHPYIDDQGKWKVPYIPLCLRLYPFLLAKSESKENGQSQYVFCLDRTADHFAGETGEPLYTESGDIRGFVTHTFDTLKLYQQELAAVQSLLARLYEMGAITDRTLEFRVGEENKSLNGFRGVDMEKLIALDDASLAEMVKNGTMSLVYCHLQSIRHLPFLHQK
nr:SapC family protein [uncultured Desulfobacter sp.]